MAAFTEAYEGLDGGRNHLGDAISMVMAARKMAEVERDLSLIHISEPTRQP